MEQKAKPEKTFRASPVSVTIWANEKEFGGKKSVFKTISFERTYRDKDGNFKKTSQLRSADIPKAVLILEKAYEYLSLNEAVSEGMA